MKRIVYISLIVAIFILIKHASATDKPHSDSSIPAISCNSCHSLHNVLGNNLGPSLSRESNSNNCYYCHTSGGPATALPFLSTEQATSSGTGRHHRWDGSMPASDSPGNAYGLRSVASLSSSTLRIWLSKFSNKATCSVCHNQHNHQNEPWDPYAPTSYTAGTTTGRHFQRIDNDLNQLCEDCHYYRAMNYTKAKGEDGAYPANGTNVFSHPVNELYNRFFYDRTAPLDYNGSPHQTSPRYYNNGTGETNKTNNIALDSSSRVRCLSCHRIHYVDSNGLTTDAP